ncbi:MAG: hypothetical protein MUF74_13715 [Cypionkella sp.]|nr:hypothetical protein [Cypionkella sp.]
MSCLSPLADCLDHALSGVGPRAAVRMAVTAAVGAVLAEDLRVATDLPPRPEALRAGVAVLALDLMGASPQMPLPLAAAVRVLPGMMLPAGTDAVLPEDDLEVSGTLISALRAPAPGEGVRLAGQDARAGLVLAEAGAVVTPKLAALAGLAGLTEVAVRRPTVAVDLPDPALAALARLWAGAEGAEIVTEAADLVLRPTGSHAPRLALFPGETAWLGPEGGRLVLDLPLRFDGALAALLALGRPALRALAARGEPAEQVTLARKLTSTIGVTELALLVPTAEGWVAEPAATVTLAGVARARASVLVPPDAEGYPGGAVIAAQPLDLGGAWR